LPDPNHPNAGEFCRTRERDNASFNFEREEREWLSSDGEREKGREGKRERLGSFKMPMEERER
jgi:hypothetical protein